MHTIETKQKFVELRARGLGISTIAKELNISEMTGTRWAGLFKKEIERTSYIELEAIQERVLMRREEELKELAEELKRTKDELGKRSFSYLTTPFLLRHKAALLARIDKLRVKPELDWEDEGDDAEDKGPAPNGNETNA